MARGLLVEVEPERVHLPRSCARCGGPATTRVLLTRPLGGLGQLSLPCCAECWLRKRGTGRVAAIGGAVGASMVLALGLGAMLELPPRVLMGISATSAAVVAFALLHLLLRWLVGTAWPPVQFVTSTQQSWTLFCCNETWGHELANASNGEVRPGNRSPDRRFASALALGTGLVALIPAMIAWETNHGSIRIDNAAVTPLLIWVDGKPVGVFEPNTTGKLPPEITVRTGRHVLGYSAPSGSEPQAPLVVHVPHGVSLYNPGKTACYWRTVAVYAANPDKARGGSDTPVPRGEFFREAGVTDWFRPVPSQVPLDGGSTTATRIAINRNASCTDLVRLGCPDAVVEKMTDCQARASTESEFQRCVVDAADGCGLKRGAKK